MEAVSHSISPARAVLSAAKLPQIDFLQFFQRKERHIRPTDPQVLWMNQRSREESKEQNATRIIAIILLSIHRHYTLRMRASMMGTIRAQTSLGPCRRPFRRNGARVTLQIAVVPHSLCMMTRSPPLLHLTQAGSIRAASRRVKSDRHSP